MISVQVATGLLVAAAMVAVLLERFSEPARR
jgi:hypothetical protein